MLMLPVIYGWQAVTVSLHMALVGLLGVLIYRWLKTSTERVRPYCYSDTIFQNVAALDQFSFPSGHTLHAVSFSWVLLSYYPGMVGIGCALCGTRGVVAGHFRAALP